MTTMLCTLTLLTLIASTYLSTACFNIVRRMSKQTPWSLAIAIISVAALGAYGFLESLRAVALWLFANFPVLSFHIDPGVGIVTLIVAVIFALNPRIDTYGNFN
jgi:hypothetical protein